jgi:hypothetical protein
MNKKSETLFHLLFFKTLILFACLTVIQVPSAFSEERFEPWDDAVYDAIAEDYGEAAGKRLRKVHDLIIKNQDLPVKDKLELINDFMNGLPWIADPDIWKREDYWATGLGACREFCP